MGQIDVLPAVSWFVAMASLGVLACVAGLWLGRRPAAYGRVTLVVGVVLLMCWAWLTRRPDVAVRLIPVAVLSRIEGVAAVPLFMLILGVSWTRARLNRQRQVIAVAVVVGMFYFVKGGWWMIQPTPALGRAQVTGEALVMQSEDYSCVPAACATALNVLGIPSSEREMAELTETRAGSGSTMLRAMAGLQWRLRHQQYTVELITAPPPFIDRVPLPALTALQFEPSRQHMVTLLGVSDYGVTYADPVDGMMTVPHDVFRDFYRGKVLVFRRKAGEAATP